MSTTINALSYTEKIWIDGERWYPYLVPQEGRNSINTLALDKPNYTEKDQHFVVCWTPGEYKGKKYLTREGPAKLFASFKSYLDFFRFQNQLPEANRNFYEVIFGTQKPHFDIDVSLDKLEAGYPGANIGIIGEFVKDAVIFCADKVLSEVGVAIDLNKDVLIYTSHGEKKRSYHIVLTNYLHWNNKEAGAFYKKVMENFKTHTGGKLAEFVDHSVYKPGQQFRILGSQKNDSNRVKMFNESFTQNGKTFKHIYNNKDMCGKDDRDLSNPTQLKLLQLEESLVSVFCHTSTTLPSFIAEKDIRHHNPKAGDLDDTSVSDCLALMRRKFAELYLQCPFEFVDSSGSLITLKRTQSSQCPCCHRLHEHEHPYLYVTATNNVYWDCRRRSDGVQSLWLGKLDVPIEEKHVSEVSGGGFSFGAYVSSDPNVQAATTPNIQVQNEDHIQALGDVNTDTDPVAALAEVTKLKEESKLQKQQPVVAPPPLFLNVVSKPVLNIPWTEPTIYPEFQKDIMQGDKGLATAFMMSHKDIFKVTTRNSEKGGIYIYDLRNNLWVDRCLGEASMLIAQFLESQLLPIIFELKKALTTVKAKSNEETKLLEKLDYFGRCLARVRSNPGRKAIGDMATDMNIVPEFVKQLDVSKDYLPILDKKVVHLRTGIPEDRTREHYFTYECPVSVGGNAGEPEVIKFFRELMCEDEANILFLQVFLGYCLTGRVDERGIYILWGEGSNGKSTLLKILQAILGRYYGTVSSTVFVKSRTDDRHANAHTEHLRPLIGARVGCCSEIDENSKLNDKLLKSISGNDEIAFRGCGGVQTTFISTAKPILATNPKPQLETLQQALIDRILLIPFLARFVDDPIFGPNLPTELRKEYKKEKSLIDDFPTKYRNDVFAWMLKGAELYYKNGLRHYIPESIKAANKDYVQEQDVVGHFLVDYLMPGAEQVVNGENKTVDGKDFVKAIDLWKKFKEENKTTTLSKSDFYEVLNKRGYSQTKGNGNCLGYKGFHLLKE